METYLALLRGVNVGGKNVLPMKDLAAIVAEGGGEAPRTYIQSGNVVFNAAPQVAAALPAAVTSAIAARFGFASPVIVRSREQVDEVVGAVPFPIDEGSDTTLHVSFLDRLPALEALASFDASRHAPDICAVRGQTVYLYLPNGMARTKLTNAYVDRALGVVSTVRNWRTVKALHGMMAR